MDRFESVLIGIVKNIKFKKIHNNIQKQMSNDIRRIKESDCIFAKSCKSGKLYEIDKRKYKQMMFKEVIKHYRKAPPNLEKELNSEAKMLASKLGIVDWVEKYNTKNCFIECRLINPAKTQIGEVSKIIVQDIYASLRLTLNINQWRSTQDCIKWFNEYDEDDKCSFIKYDIKEFYPSITEKNIR